MARWWRTSSGEALDVKPRPMVVATISATIDVHGPSDDARGLERVLLVETRSDLDALRRDLSEAISVRLGDHFEMRSLSVEEGSIVIGALVVFVGQALINYGGLRQSLDYLREDVRRVLWRFTRRHVRGPSMGIVVTVAPTGAVVQRSVREVAWEPSGNGDVLLRYLVASHAALLLAVLVGLGYLLVQAT